MKTVFTGMTILGVVAGISGVPFVVNAQQSPQPIVRNGARYFQNVGVGNNSRQIDFQRTLDSNNRIILTNPNFTLNGNNRTNIPAALEDNGTPNQSNSQLNGLSATGVPQYTYNQEVLVLPLAERQQAIPYNRPGDASFQLRLGDINR
ncbi:hypothetical protein H6F77_14010 [Microcoleus sp. FACHB-831]|jgi:hypothetical protein|uniref:hypothetical protein n=1 Tax=Microcoleus sp. FACHB-831 TaxID=2692827 RepID=UPI001683E4DB|nr:hypothetical protein [Microcoleus sp. FACHB-831]MBD1922198.1 hypothetical protein [Microcoleus sp. FACHB-831]